MKNDKEYMKNYMQSYRNREESLLRHYFYKYKSLVYINDIAVSYDSFKDNLIIQLEFYIEAKGLIELCKHKYKCDDLDYYSIIELINNFFKSENYERIMFKHGVKTKLKTDLMKILTLIK